MALFHRTQQTFLHRSPDVRSRPAGWNPRAKATRIVTFINHWKEPEVMKPIRIELRLTRKAN